MKWRLMAALPVLLPSAAALAQPADLPIPAATTTTYPPGVSVAETARGPVYVDAQGRTLYGMDMRTLLRWGSDPAKYCKDDCAQLWEPVLAPAGAKVNIAYPQGFGRRPGQQAAPMAPDPDFHSNPQKAPDWTIIQGTQGPQWVYKGWHMVFARRGDKPGSTEFDGAEKLTWNTLKFVPPVPKVEAPANVSTIFVDGAYALADGEGRVLFTGDCGSECSSWKPLAGGMASRGVGQWKISRDGDTAQWTYNGKRVFVSQLADPTQVPEAGTVLRPESEPAAEGQGG